MDALTALHTRNSVNLIEEPGPSASQLDNIIRAGLRACDHGNLKPWKYLLIDGPAREKFGNLMVKVKEAQNGGPIEKSLADKLRKKPMRAPTIIVVVANTQVHEKIPEIEQLLSAGAGAQMMMTAAYAQGFGAIWRSGSLMFHSEMQRGLGLLETQKIVGFIYIGTPKVTKPLPELTPELFLQRWEG